MLFDLRHIQKQLAAAPITSPYPHDLAVAIVSDTFRRANARPPSRQTWEGLERRFDHALWKEQVGMLAHVLASTSLRDDTANALKNDANAKAILERFFSSIVLLTAEMVRSNVFRQEEFLRKWVRSVDGQVLNESARESAARLEQIDYRKAYEELKRAEKARKKEAEAREKALKEAEQRATDPRGWRE